MNSVGTVSYTHLDVYKRQSQSLHILGEYPKAEQNKTKSYNVITFQGMSDQLNIFYMILCLLFKKNEHRRKFLFETENLTVTWAHFCIKCIN